MRVHFFKIKKNLTLKTSCNQKAKNFYIVTQKNGHHSIHLSNQVNGFVGLKMSFLLSMESLICGGSKIGLFIRNFWIILNMPLPKFQRRLKVVLFCAFIFQ